MGHVVHAVLEDLGGVGLLHQGVEAHADLALAGGTHLVVMHFKGQSHLLHRGAHGGADVVQGIYRRHGEVSALDAGPVADVAVFEGVAGLPGGLFGRDGIAGAAHVRVPLHVVEYEEFRLVAEVGGVTQAGAVEVGLCALGHGAGIPVVALHGAGLDALPAVDGGAVEHLAPFEEVCVDQGRGDGDMLLLALGVREAQVDPAGFVIFYQLQSLL